MQSFIQNTFTEHLGVLGKEDTQQKRKQSPLHRMNLLASWLTPSPQVHLLLLASFPYLSSPWVLHFLFIWLHWVFVVAHETFVISHGIFRCSTQAF